MKMPRVFEAKNFGGRDISRNSHFQGDMIRGRARERGERSVSEGSIPSQVKEGPVKAFKSRRGSHVRPCDLNKAEVPDQVVESLSSG